MLQILGVIVYGFFAGVGMVIYALLAKEAICEWIIKRRNKKRRQEQYEKAFGDHAEYIRACRCIVPGCTWTGPCDPHHVKSRGAGGTWRDLVPLCRQHH